MVFKMLQLPLSLFRKLILPHLPLEYFDFSLLATGQFMVSLPDTFGNQVPKRTRLVGTLGSIGLASYNGDDFFAVGENIVKLGFGTRTLCEFGVFVP